MRPPPFDPKFAKERVSPTVPASAGRLDSVRPPKVLEKYAIERFREVHSDPKISDPTISLSIIPNVTESQNAKVRTVRSDAIRNGYKFEYLVVSELRLAGIEMMATSKSRDDGLDCIIYNGFHKIGVQMKFYSGKVPGPDVQKFIGALEVRNLKFGVFITNSYFTKAAVKYVDVYNAKKRGSQRREIFLVQEFFGENIRQHSVLIRDKVSEFSR